MEVKDSSQSRDEGAVTAEKPDVSLDTAVSEGTQSSVLTDLPKEKEKKDEVVTEANEQPSSNEETPLSMLATSSKEKQEKEEVATEANAQPKKSQTLKLPVWIITVLSILSSTFLFALDNTMVADVQPKIIDSLGEIEKLPWISVAFALGAASVNLVWGKLYGEFNNKPVFITAITIFEVGSAVCGAAPTMNALIIGRAIAGTGGSGIYIGAINIISACTETSQRPLYLSFVGVTWSSGTVLGPIVGGAFAESRATWRWAFYINLCVAALAAPSYFFLLPSCRPKPGVSIKQRIRSLDFLGIVLFSGASVSLVMGIAFGGAIYVWKGGQIIGLFVCAGVLWISFVLQQSWHVLTTKEDRLFPVTFLKSPQMCILFAEVATCAACIFIPVYFIPVYFEFVRNDSALEAGVRLLPFVFVAVFGAMINGVVMKIYGLYMPWFAAGGVLITIGGGLLYTIHLDSSDARVYGYSAIAAIGTGFFIQAPFSVAQAKVAPHLVPTATAFISCGQIAGITLSLSVATSILVNQATDKIARILPGAPHSAIRALIAGAGSSFFDDQNASDQRRILEAIVSTVDNIYIMVIVGGGVAVILSMFMKRERLFLEAGAVGA